MPFGVIAAGCVLTMSSCGPPFLPVRYETSLVLKVCAPKSPGVPASSPCPALISNAVSTRNEVAAALGRRSDAAQAQSSVTVAGDGDIDVRTTLAMSQAVSLFSSTGSIAFASATPGSPDPSNASFLTDQQGRFDASQFTDPNLYPTGFHWKIDTSLPAADVMSATVGTDSTSGVIAVDINFNSAGATEWTRITNAAYAAYTSDPADPGAAQVGLFLDDAVLAAPIVTGAGQSNQTEITGAFTAESASALAADINTGALPAPVAVVSINGAPSSAPAA
jgi:preprotein translocase subunit SecD